MSKFLNNQDKLTQKSSTILRALQYSHTIAEPGIYPKSRQKIRYLFLFRLSINIQHNLVGYVTEYIDKLAVIVRNPAHKSQVELDILELKEEINASDDQTKISFKNWKCGEKVSFAPGRN